MKRTTISLNNEVAKLVQDYINKQEVAPSLSAVVNQALLDFVSNKTALAELKKRGLELEGLKPFPKEIYSFSKTTSQETDISTNHDKYLSENVADDY